jgi:Rab GDP dissociation inhibitor
MLSRDAQEFVYDSAGRVCGVVSNGETVKCKGVICDPSYVKDKVKTSDKVIRATCLLKAPIPNTGDADSVQLIIPQNQVGRHHDIYVAMVGYEHRVSGKGYYVAIVSTIVETSDPAKEIHPALALLGPIDEMWVDASEADVSHLLTALDGVFSQLRLGLRAPSPH